MNRKVLSANDTGFTSYANYTVISQSSGMGKSRMIDELSKWHFVIPINTRDISIDTIHNEQRMWSPQNLC